MNDTGALELLRDQAAQAMRVAHLRKCDPSTPFGRHLQRLDDAWKHTPAVA